MNAGIRWTAGCAVLAAMALTAAAIDDGSKPMTPRERAKAVLENTRELHRAIQADQWDKAKGLCETLVELQPRSANYRYNLACCHAHLKDPNAALDALAKSIELGYDNVDHMKADKDLAPLRKTDRWDALVKKASESIERTMTKDGDEVVVTGKAGGGLHYRVRLSRKASKQRPHRLVVWLHPSGGSGNKAAEKLTELFHKQGYALMVFTKKDFRGWSEASFNRAIRTVNALKDIPQLDPNRPMLMGYSAGGQIALKAWASKPGYFSGLILDAAYPIDTAAYAQGRIRALPVRNKPHLLKACPLFVLVGDEDNGSKLWKKVEDPWEKAGVPLEIHYVKGGRHEWLFGGKQTKALAKWLSRVRKVKAPTTQPAEDAKDAKDADGTNSSSDQQGRPAKASWS
ncbi:MAG: TPR end-of-group domain-containing protein [Phycisphaerae bacterium]